jgi:NADPH2:quinone reductase
MQNMKYIDLHASGGADQMYVAEGPLPNCGPNEVVIKVAAVGINRPDILQREGLYDPPKQASPVMGLEAAGEVCEIGLAVEGWNVGDKVCALCNGGAYAEYVAVPAGQCLPIPGDLSLVEAASLPETFFTVWANVFLRGNLSRGDSILIHGGGSGIGVAAIQLSKAFGATVLATARSRAKCTACEKIGADWAIDSISKDFVSQVMRITDNVGVDVILDMVGGDYIRKNIKCAAVDGRIINIAFLAGAVNEINFMPIMIKRLTLTGSTLRPQTPEFKRKIATDLYKKVWPLIASGKIRPIIHDCFSMSEVAEAHRMMEENQHIGKIIMTVD